MKKLIVNSLFLLICTISTASHALDVKDFYCDALSSEAAYKKHRAYKMLVPGTEGWIFRTFSDFRSDFSMDDRYMKKIKELSDGFEERGITFIMLYPPTRGLLHADHVPADIAAKFEYTDVAAARESYKNALTDFQKAGLKVVGLPDQPPGEPFFYKRDHHWNATGARIAAVTLADYIKTLPVYQELDKKTFVTKSMGTIDFIGTAKRVFSDICGNDLPPEKAEKYMTETDADSASTDALFGDYKDPEVVLLGTSNSTYEPSVANFEGFLKEALGTDILNMSVSGGSIDTAMISYLNSDHYKEGKAKLVIWEVPGYYNLNRMEQRIYRQAIPATYGSCADNAVARAENVTLEDTDQAVLSDLNSLKIMGSEHYIHLKFSRPVDTRFTVHMDYYNTDDQLPVTRSARYPHDGEFYVALKDTKLEPLSRVRLEMPEKYKGAKVTAEICKVEKGDPHAALFE